MGPDYLVAGPADQQFPCAHRRLCRRGGGSCRPGARRNARVRRVDPGTMAAHPDLHFRRAAHRTRLGLHPDDCRLLAVPGLQPRRRWTKWFRKLQLLSAATFSLSHGANDAQKTMGIITGVLVASGFQKGFRDSPVGDSGRPRRHRHGHLERRMAHRSHHGRTAHAPANRAAGSAPKPEPPPRSCWPRTWACPSPPRTPSPGPSPESAASSA